MPTLGGFDRAVGAENKMATWPLQDIAITNIVWCVAYERGVGRGSYTAEVV